MKRPTWRKEPNETGLARVCQGVRGWDLMWDRQDVVHVRPVHKAFNQYEIHGWYFYGGIAASRINTYSDYGRSGVYETPELAKEVAMKWFKDALKVKQ